MKINIGVKELVEFIAGQSNSEELKKTIAGAFVAIANDPVVEASMRQRVQQLGESELRKVMDEAIIKTGAYGGKTVGGWAYEMVKQTIAAELKSVKLNEAIKEVVQSEIQQIRIDRAKMVEDIQSIVESVLHRMLPTMFTHEYADRIADKYDASTLRKMVSEECVAYMRAAFKG